jgi:hypothetical protein
LMLAATWAGLGRVRADQNPGPTQPATRAGCQDAKVGDDEVKSRK